MIQSFPSCFWALLSVDNLRFLYLSTSAAKHYVNGKSPKDILVQRSLFDFIHPDELEPARTDLSNFVQVKTLAAAVTRCRLRTLEKIACQNRLDGACQTNKDNFTTLSNKDPNDWAVVDVVMYTATENVILAFFHRDEDQALNPQTIFCGEKVFNSQDAAAMMEIIQQHTPKAPDLLRPETEPLRVFQIHNTFTRQLIASWPPKESTDEPHPILATSSAAQPHDVPIREQLFDLANELAREVSRKEIYSTNDTLPTDIACTQHFHSSTTLPLQSYGMCRFEKLIVPYGVVAFGLFQVTGIQRKRTSDLRPYQHYMHCVSDVANTNTPDSGVRSSPHSAFRTTASPSPSASSDLPALLHEPRHLMIQNQLNQSCNTSFYAKHDATYDDMLPTTKKIIPSDAPSSERSMRASHANLPRSPKRCENCNTDSSPEWRRGPSGHKTLCNACGLRYSRLLAKQERSFVDTTRVKWNKNGAGLGRHGYLRHRPLHHS